MSSDALPRKDSTPAEVTGDDLNQLLLKKVPLHPRDPRRFGARCRWCPFSKNGAPVQPVWGEGPAVGTKAKGLVVAESPGYEEVARGRPFVGSSGVEFDRSLMNIGLPRAHLFLINAVACQPVGIKSEKSMTKAADCCRPFVLHQIHHLPNHIPTITMGVVAFYSLHGSKVPLEKGRGFLRRWSIWKMHEANFTKLGSLIKEMIKYATIEKVEEAGSGRSKEGEDLQHR